jgi:hypothetical protein
VAVGVPPYKLEFYEDDDGHEPALAWLRSLDKHKRRAIGVALHEILQHEGPKVIGTNFGKALSGGLFEFRLDQTSEQILHRKGKPAEPEPDRKIVLRVFCHAHGQQIVLLLGGYDKGESPSKSEQQAQIETARTRLADWRKRNRRR